MDSYLVLPIVQAVICIVLAVLVIRNNSRSILHRLFMLFLLIMGGYALAIFGMRSSPDVQSALRWEHWIAPIGQFGAAVLFHFSVRYSYIKLKSFILPLIYVIAIASVPLSFTSFFIKAMQLKPYGYAPVFGPLMPVHLVYIYALTITTLVIFTRYFRASSQLETRNRTLYIIAGISMSLIGGLFDILPSLGLPLYPGLIIGNIIFFVLTAIAIGKHNLLDIRIVIRRGTAYFIASLLLSLPFITIFVLYSDSFVNSDLMWWISIALMLVLAASMPIWWNTIQELVNKWFLRERYNYLRQLEAFSQETHRINDLDQLSLSTVKLISQALQTSKVLLLLVDKSGDFNTISTIGEPGDLTLQGKSLLVRWLQSRKDILYRRQLDLVPHLQSLPRSERTKLDELGIEIIMPLKTMNDELIGLLMLGEKLTRRPYTEEDRQLIVTVASRVAIELENARLYTAETTARVELQRQNEQKTEFLHTVAHELKTPLTSLIAAMELFTGGTELSSTQRERLINILKNSTEAMDRRVNELLVLARMQTGELVLKKSLLNLPLFLEELTSQISILFDQKKQKLHLDIEEHLPSIDADRDRLEQIILNLVTNAIKYSPSRSDIAFKVGAQNGDVVFEVEDAAPIISTEEAERLFDPYYRGQDTVEKEHLPGLGLGLYLVKRLVELHNGEIWVKSMPGKGNVFAFSLKAAADSAPAVN